MLRNYFTIACRQLIRNKEYTVINILGLAVSIASCLLLFYVIRYELSFDAFHFKRDRIYRIVTETQEDGGMDYGQGVPAPFSKAMRLDFPQVQRVAEVLSIPNSQIDILDDGQKHQAVGFIEASGVFFAEPQVFDIFDFAWLHGSPGSLTEPNTVVLTQEMAEKYFGDWRSAIGKSIEYRNKNVLKIMGILKNIPANSDLPLRIVISYPTLGPQNESWGSVTSRRQCYILLDEHTPPDQIQGQMASFEKKHHPAESDIGTHYILQPLADIHFDDRFGNYNHRTISKMTLLSLAMIGILLMVTASINFVNLTIAQVMKRSKEVGIRKVLGSNRWQLSGQFFGEVSLLLIASSVLAIVLTELALPPMRSILNLPSSLPPATPLEVTAFLIVISIVIAIFSGFYPVRVLAGLRPVQALKSRINTQEIGGISVRKSLVVVQFAIAQVLVIITLIVVQQLDFFRSAPLGFDKESVVLFSVPPDSVSQARMESFRTRLLQVPEVRSISFSFAAPLASSNRRRSFQFDGSAEDAPFEANLKFADVEFFNTYNLPLVAGRVYQSSDTAREYVVNETFLKKFGIHDPEEGLGKVITMNDVSLPIVGIVKDYHLLSLQRKIEPLILMTERTEYRNAGVKLEGNIRQGIQKIEKLYRSFFRDNIFEYTFLDSNIAKSYAEEERLSSIIRIFSGIAIFVSCLGLYGLISFMAVQRTKEVGVRKVLGASARDIVLLFYKEFIVLVLTAFIFSAPVTWYLMSGWLDGFAYRIDLGPWVFILAITLSAIIALATISLRSIRAALANPVESLRSE